MRSRNSKSSTGRLSWMLSDVLKSKRAEGYVDTAVKVLIAVVIGALLLFGLYGLVGNVVIPTTTSKVSSLFNTTGVDGAGTGGGAGGGTPVTPEPEIKREPGSIIPDGAKYTKADGTVLEGNGTNVIPSTYNQYDEYKEGDYCYTLAAVLPHEWCATVIDKTKTEYGQLLSGIAGLSVTNVSFFDCHSLETVPIIPNSVTELSFTNCTSLVTAPAIPNSVTDLSFANCTSLVAAPAIPSSVTRMSATFFGCTSLVTAPAIPDNVTDMHRAFYGCTSLTVAPIIPDSVSSLYEAFCGCTSMAVAPVIPDSVTNMYGTFKNCTALVTAPVISINVQTSMEGTFQCCTSLTGTIEINGNPILYTDCFKDTVKAISLTGSSYYLTDFAATANNGNVTVA